ncbi:MAG: hypothetical protein K8R76_05645 [Candidatus Aegiribacteria sp.]|nr:hypothetical protein [Candidatus Aegiribacteria sp.]
MNSDDRIHLENLRTLEFNYQIDSTDWTVAVELAETLHALRRDKPALEIMRRIPVDELSSQDRLFMAMLLVYDCNISDAARVAAPVLIPIAAILLAAGSGFLYLSGKRRDQ